MLVEEDNPVAALVGTPFRAEGDSLVGLGGTPLKDSLNIILIMFSVRTHLLVCFQVANKYKSFTLRVRLRGIRHLLLGWITVGVVLLLMVHLAVWRVEQIFFFFFFWRRSKSEKTCFVNFCKEKIKGRGGDGKNVIDRSQKQFNKWAPPNYWPPLKKYRSGKYQGEKVVNILFLSFFLSCQKRRSSTSWMKESLRF